MKITAEEFDAGHAATIEKAAATITTTTRVSPIMIETMLHCFYSSLPLPRYHTLAVKGAVAWLREQGLVEPGLPLGTFHATVKGQAWVEMICRTPLPRNVNIWVDQEGHKIFEA